MPRWPRRRWFKIARRVAALHRVMNAAGVHAPRRDDSVVERGLTKRGKWRRLPDVVHLSEVAGVNVRQIASALGYHTVQFGGIGTPAAGVALCLRRKTVQLVGEPTLKWASEAVAGEVRARPIVTARVSVRGSEPYYVSATHAPPDRTPAAQRKYLRTYREIPDVIGGDHNDDVAEMRDAFDRTYRGIGVLGALIPRNFKASAARAVKGLGDHLGVDFVARMSRDRDR